MEKKRKLIENFGIVEESLIEYPNDIFKIDSNFYKDQKRKAKLILLTAISPTKYGEGKTTCSIGLADALTYLNHKTLLALREPSMGPVFGSKGTATGGGECTIEPSNEINLHFTSDIHAITSANNLISAAIDSHIYWGNEMKIDLETINWSRCLDVNDRALRKITINIKKNISREESFVITAASKMMIVLSLAKDENDLRKRLEETIFAFDVNQNPLYLKSLNIVGAVMATLSISLKPNLVFTKHGTPALIHCGPFANIATGTNSVIATDLALKLSDLVVTEAGFSSELGFEKFSNVVGPENNFKPDCVVLVGTIRALKEKRDFENNFLSLSKHIKNIQYVTSNILFVINKFSDDNEDDLIELEKWLIKNNCDFAVNNSYIEGPEGGLEFAKKVLKIIDNKNDFYSKIYNLKSLYKKIQNITKNFYHLENINISENAKKKLEEISVKNREIFENWPVVVAKSQNSIDGNDANESDYVMTIRDIEINTSAKFVLIFTNKILMMPGLPKEANFIDIDLINDKIINMK